MELTARSRGGAPAVCVFFFAKDSSPNASGPGGRRFIEDGDEDMVAAVLGL